jgi:ParB family chromosome partitioning protein
VQRSFSDLSHSERSVALKYHMDAISKQGKRNDLLDEIEKLSNPDEIKSNETSALIVPKSTAREKTGEKYGLNRMSVTRYLRLSYLIKPLLYRTDNEEIGLYPAVSLSYLSADEQSEVNRILDETKYKINIKKAESLRDCSENKKLSNDMILQILSGETNKKPKMKAPASFKLKGKILAKYFPDKKTGEIEAEIIEAIEFFRANKK